MNNLFASRIMKLRSLNAKVIAAFCMVVLFQLFSTNALFAQGGIVSVSLQNVHSVVCGEYRCCLKVTVSVAAGGTMSSFEITSINRSSGTDAPGDCWDLSCAIASGNQYLSNGTIWRANPPGTPYIDNVTGQIHFDFSTAVTGPAIFEFLICAKNSCAWTEWSDMNWSATTDVPLRIPEITNETGDPSIGSGCDNVPLCPTCDQV